MSNQISGQVIQRREVMSNQIIQLVRDNEHFYIDITSENYVNSKKYVDFYRYELEKRFFSWNITRYTFKDAPRYRDIIRTFKYKDGVLIKIYCAIRYFFNDRTRFLGEYDLMVEIFNRLLKRYNS